ncbi:MAG TPA: YciI family protein [Prolixibacteraceae bacterium]|jgi:uncharacterized protein YciI
MKIHFLLLSLTMTMVLQAVSQQNPPSVTPKYNAEMAQKLGADNLGMRNYVIAFLKSGPVKLTDSLQRAELQKAHLKNITKMVDMGKLILAGPFMDDQPLRGIYIFDVATLEEAEQLTSTDPAVKAGTLIMELHPWYGSAALKEIPDLHKQIQKKGFGE